MIFTKNPVAGKVKTRLAKDLGNEKALKIYEFLLDHSAEITKDLDVDKQVFYSESVIEQDVWGADFSKKKQRGKDLGERMYNAFREGFEDGYEQIIIIGSDLYQLNSLDLEKAFDELDSNEFVVGPAEDGGYYLLGMKTLNSEIFKNKEWGTSSVLKDTLNDIQTKQIKMLETRNDVDVLDDIKDHPAFQKFIA
ncbi:glycosyltransferase [Christiangramia salexigens]|uniref:Glycosyltransferase n=2 Tax=Christiangramia salexigens TaxID=1913577 RepID=A0A1L3J8H7_9FLAO|nr:TIGR04282 family arsenosugar biosynthesis glycosyltransferase [Christiangramia salexigens]APG61442.1 glycosyltransferase [Christiangramia salexigens]